jgi:hypothetical protein
MEAKTSNTDQRIRKDVSKSALEVSRVYAANYQKEGTLTAEIKQTVTTNSYYPSKSVSNNLKDNPFSNAEFGFNETMYSSSQTRVVWVEVPSNSTVESVKAKIASLPESTIYRIYSNQPIISDSQHYAINAGLTSKESIADSQSVRYPEGDPQAGLLILKSGKPQFKADFFKTTSTEDVDSRNDVADDCFITAKMRAELAGTTMVASVQDAL